MIYLLLDEVDIILNKLVEIGLGHTVQSVHKSLKRYTRSSRQGHESLGESKSNAWSMSVMCNAYVCTRVFRRNHFFKFSRG